MTRRGVLVAHFSHMVRSMIRSLQALSLMPLSAALLISCGGTSSDPPKTAATAEEKKEVQDPAKAARELSAAATKEMAPPPPQAPDQVTSHKYVNGPLRDWFAKVAPKIEAAHTEYGRIIAAAEGTDAIAYYKEATELLLFIPRQLRTIEEAAMPLGWRDNPDLKSRFSANIAMLAAPFYRIAGQAVVQCVKLGTELKQEKTALESCGKLADEISSALASAAPASAPVVKRVSHDILPPGTAPVSGCEFGGGANDLNHRLALGEKSGSLGRVHAATFKSFQLKKTAEGRHVVELSWPFVGSFHLEGQPLLLTTKKLDFLDGHVWHPASAPVDAFALNEKQVLVHLRLPGREEPIESSVPCGSLNIGSLKPFELKDGVAFLTKPAPLSDDAKGSSMGLVGGPLAGVVVLEKKDSSARVKSEENPYIMFEGWIPETHIAPRPRKGVTKSSPPEEPGTHVTGDGALLQIGKGQSIPMAAGVPVIIDGEKGDFALVRVAGFQPNPGEELRIEKTKLIPNPPSP